MNDRQIPKPRIVESGAKITPAVQITVSIQKLELRDASEAAALQAFSVIHHRRNLGRSLKIRRSHPSGDL